MTSSLGDIQFPAYQLPSNPLKRLVKLTAATVLALVLPTRMNKVRAGDLPDILGRVDRLLVARWVAKCEAQDRIEDLTPLHRWLWRSEQALDIHALCEERFENLWTPHLSEICTPIAEIVGQQPEHFTTLCEIGCGTGTVLKDIARRLSPNELQYIGLDLCEPQIAQNEANNRAENFKYVAADAQQWLPSQLNAGWITITNGGVFEYFTAEQLSSLFKSIHDSARPGILALAEPIPNDFDFTSENESRAWQAEKTLGHNYPLLVKNAGLEIVFQKDILIDDLRWLLIVAATPCTDSSA